jgi:hypothetical protein
MKKLYYMICFAVMLVFAASCSKDDVVYDTTDLSSGAAEFQLHYCAPVVASTANIINAVMLDNDTVSNYLSPLKTYNAIPSGSVGRFYATTSGTKELKMFTGTKNAYTQVYDQQVTLTSGKQNIFVYSLTAAPIVFDNEYPYSANETTDTDSTAYVKFYNFMYEDETTPTTMKLQYKCYCQNPTTKQYTDTVAVGKPVSFGETTGWQSIKVLKTIFNSSGYCNVYYLIDVIDVDGTNLGSLQITNSKGKLTDYSDYWTAYIGRRYHHVLNRIRTSKTLRAQVSQFTAL